MTTALYRINGGEVLKISTTDQTFAERDTDYWAVLTDPTLPDGTEVREGNTGPLRVLGYSKFADVGGNEVRNATQPEIDTFAPAETEDENLMDQGGARGIFAQHPRWRKLLTAIVDVNILEFNIQRDWNMQMQQAIADAQNLSQLKTLVAALPDLQPRTLSAFKAAVIARISEDD